MALKHQVAVLNLPLQGSDDAFTFSWRLSRELKRVSGLLSGFGFPESAYEPILWEFSGQGHDCILESIWQGVKVGSSYQVELWLEGMDFFEFFCLAMT